MLIFILIVVIFIFFLIWYKKIEFEILKEGLKWYYLIFLFIMVLLVLVVGNLVYYLVDIGSFYV